MPRLLFALSAVALIAGCSGQEQAEKVYNEIGRISSASSQVDFEARVRDLEKDLDEVKPHVDAKQYDALFLYASTAKRKYEAARFADYMINRGRNLPAKYQQQILDDQKVELEDAESEFNACRDDASRSIFGDSGHFDTKAGDCYGVRIQHLEREQRKLAETKKTQN